MGMFVCALFSPSFFPTTNFFFFHLHTQKKTHFYIGEKALLYDIYKIPLSWLCSSLLVIWLMLFLCLTSLLPLTRWWWNIRWVRRGAKAICVKKVCERVQTRLFTKRFVFHKWLYVWVSVCVSMCVCCKSNNITLLNVKWKYLYLSNKYDNMLNQMRKISETALMWICDVMEWMWKGRGVANRKEITRQKKMEKLWSKWTVKGPGVCYINRMTRKTSYEMILRYAILVKSFMNPKFFSWHL